MSMTVARRTVLGLAGASSLWAAMGGAVRAEGGVLRMLDLLSAPADLAPGEIPFANRTPIRCGEAALRVRDLDTMIAYYRDAIGLSVLDRSPEGAVMGVDGVALLHLLSRPDAALESPMQAGLFHIAFLMPSRRDLARWLVHAAINEVPFTGFADHSVSEAIYLNDPEGNGLEIYADRPPELWQWSADGLVTMGTHPLDIDAILALTSTDASTYSQAPDRLRIGHMHLRVGNIATGRAFYQEALGLDSTRGTAPDSAFLASGGYHHHVALNIWNSQGAGPRSAQTTGLDWFSLHVADADILAAQTARLGGVEVNDPWGTGVRLIAV